MNHSSGKEGILNVNLAFANFRLQSRTLNADTGAVHLGQSFLDIDHVDILTREEVVNFDFLLGSINRDVHRLAHTGVSLGT